MLSIEKLKKMENDCRREKMKRKQKSGKKFDKGRLTPRWSELLSKYIQSLYAAITKSFFYVAAPENQSN